MSVSINAFFEEAHKMALNRLRHEPKLSFLEWGEKYLENPDGTRFKFRPYQMDPARDMFSPDISLLGLQWFSGAGKTYLFQSAFGYAVDQLRAEIGAMFPNQDLAESWVRSELMEFFAATPRLAKLGLITDNLSYKRYKNGAEIAAMGANSAGKIRRLQASIVFADEIDAIKQDVSDEGDKLAQLWKRSRGRKMRNHWASSYPSKKGASKIESILDTSDKCKWHQRCVKCNEVFIGHSKMIVYPNEKPEKALLECPSCSRGLTDAERIEGIYNGGHWRNRYNEPITGVEYNGIRGYHLGCMANVAPHGESYANYLHEVAAEIISNRNSENPEKSKRVFVNTMDAESFEEEFEEKVDPDDLYNLREQYDPEKMLPEGVLCITAGVDIQKNRFEYEIVGHGLNEETWGIEYGIVNGSALKQSTWDKLDKKLAETFRHPLGGRLPISCTGVDSGHWQESVLAYTKDRGRRGIYAIKGARTLGRPIYNKPSKVGRNKTAQYPVGTHEAKDLIYQYLALRKSPEAKKYPRGYMHFPENEDYGRAAGGEASGYFEMMTAEDSKLKKAASGDELAWFECPDGVRNEAFDCRVYAMWARRKKRPNFQRLWSSMKEAFAENEAERMQPEETLSSPRKVKRRSGYSVKSW